MTISKTLAALIFAVVALPASAGFSYKAYVPGLVAAQSAGGNQPAAPESCVLPWGGKLAAGQSYSGTVYASATVNAPGECLTVTETCNANGTLTYPGAALSCSVVDPYWAQTVALLSMDSTAWTDAKGHVFSSVGASLSATAKVGLGSVNFTTAGTRLSTPYSADFDFGTGDFTVEGWTYLTGGANTWRELVSRYAGAPTGYYIFGLNQSNRLSVVVDGVVQIQGSLGLGFNQWHHIAWTREAGTVRLFVDGQLDTSGALPQALNSSNGLSLGASNTGIEGMAGMLDEVRITKGVARYKTTFTPSAAALPQQ